MDPGWNYNVQIFRKLYQLVSDMFVTKPHRQTPCIVLNNACRNGVKLSTQWDFVNELRIMNYSSIHSSFLKKRKTKAFFRWKRPTGIFSCIPLSYIIRFKSHNSKEKNTLNSINFANRNAVGGLIMEKDFQFLSDISYFM